MALIASDTSFDLSNIQNLLPHLLERETLLFLLYYIYETALAELVGFFVKSLSITDDSRVREHDSHLRH